MNYKMSFFSNCLKSLRRKHLELFLFHIKEALIHVDMQYWTKEEWTEEKTIWELYIQIVKADQFLFWGGCRLFHLYDKENRVYAGCVWIWHSLCFDQWMCLLSPLVTVSCCSYEHSSPTQTAGGPLALGSSFSPRTYRHREQRRCLHW